MTSRRRSFHLNANASPTTAITAPRPAALNPQHIEASVLSIGLLAFARQASVFAFTLLGGCAPGMRSKPKRVPRALLAGTPRQEVNAVMEASRDDSEGQRIQAQTDDGAKQNCEFIATTVDPQINEFADAGAGEVDLGVGDAEMGPQIQARDINVVSSVPKQTDHAPPSSPAVVPDSPVTLTEKTTLYLQTRVKSKPVLITPPTGVGLGLLIPSTSTNELRLLSPLESRCASPKPEFEPVHSHLPPAARSSDSELRADLVRKVAAFTAARLSGSRGPSASPPPRAALIRTPPLPSYSPAYLDDPFSETCAATPRAPFVPTHPVRFGYPSLQFCPDQPQSPTPHPKTGCPPLRQRTVFFKQVSPRAGTPPPQFWAPHPAGSRSCAITIKAPLPTSMQRRVAGDKENRAV